MPRIDAPQIGSDATYVPQQERDRQNLTNALAATEETEGSQGTLEKRRNHEAHDYSSGLFRGVAGSPLFKMGKTLEARELSALVSDTLAEENIPASLKAEAREIVGTVATMRAGGNRKAAEDYARSAAQSFGRKLARSSWAGPPEDDFDPRAAVANIPRNRS